MKQTQYSPTPIQIQITTRGKRHLGAIIGDEAYKNEHVNNKVNEWVDQISI